MRFGAVRVLLVARASRPRLVWFRSWRAFALNPLHGQATRAMRK